MTKSAIARAMAKERWAKPDARAPGKAGGRPRSSAPRCPCGKSTLKRAQARAFDCCKAAGIENPEPPFTEADFLNALKKVSRKLPEKPK